MATINGTSRDDRLTGTDAADRLNGRRGNDTLYGGEGLDTLNGGAGDDTYKLDYRIHGDYDVILDSGGIDTVFFVRHSLGIEDRYVLPDGLENLTVTQYMEAFGNDLDNVIRIKSPRQFGEDTVQNGGGGNDTLIGGHSNDQFYFDIESGSYGHDVVDGRGGADALYVGERSSVVADFRSGTVVGGGAGGSGKITFTNIEVIEGGPYNDRLIADAAGRILIGNGGNDTLLGGAGDDALAGSDGGDGADGVDRLIGKGGNDILSGEPGVDFMNGGRGKDTIEGTYNLDLTAISNSRILNIEVIGMSGRPGNVLTLNEQDILDMSSSTDKLWVLAGHDSGGGTSNSVDIVGPFIDRGVSGDFHRYKVGSAILLVETEIAVS